ncbi:MAG: EAL domain-containing protein [Lachnospiraceae bacterium]
MNIKMQFCGLILLMVILYFYICRKKIKLHTAQAFMRIFWITVLNLVLDITSIILLDYHIIVPDLLINAVCKTYISTLVLVGMAAFLYICADIYGESRQYKKRFYLAITIATIGIALIFALPIYKSWNNPDQIYTYGPSVMVTYAFAVFFLTWIIILLIAKRKRIDNRRWEAMCIWMVLWLLATGVQFAFNEILLVGYASAIGIVIVYLKLENPELNIDKGTGMFNQEGLLLYTAQLIRGGKKFAVMVLELQDILCVHSATEEQSTVRMEIITWLLEMKDAYVFKNRENEVVLVFEDHEKAEQHGKLMKERFESSWGTAGNTYIRPQWTYMPDGSIITDSDELLHLLDYARLNGTNYMDGDTVIIGSKMRDDMYEEKKVEHLIQDALENDRVEVFYQPIYSTQEKSFIAAEALVRIRDEEGELVPPGVFINIAERNGSIIKLGEAVFRMVCAFLKDRKPEQYGLKYIEINLSVVQCAYEQLSERFIHIMEEYQISPERINLEITESASLEAKKVLLDNMKKLMDYGVTFSLDDFGTGQSNLNYIVEMPVDIVKFDRDMINSYFENGKAKYVMDAAMRMIHGMQLKIVSEGIETKEQFDTMEELQINYIQGFYFSRPLPENDFIHFLASDRQNER